MKLINVLGIIGIIVFAGAGLQHGQFHLYNSVVPHVHENGVVHSH